MSTSVEVVNASVALHRALWKLRAAIGRDTEFILHLKGVPKPLRGLYTELQKNLGVIRRSWPRCSDIECVSIATAVTQAASISLTHELRGPVSKNRPQFADDTTVHRVLKDTLMWMFHVADRECDISPILSRTKDGGLTRHQAQAFRDQLVQAMPGILQWADDMNDRD